MTRRAPWERGLGRAAVFELSEIVRDYLGKRLRFPALDLTTDEVVEELKRRRILGLDLAGLRDDFAWRFYKAQCQRWRLKWEWKKGEIDALAVSPDGKLLATSKNQVITIW